MTLQTNRRRLCHLAAAALAAGLLAGGHTHAAETDGTFDYRGFTVDMSAAGVTDPRALRASLEHQIDIAADCGASPEVMRFFRSQRIIVRSGFRDGGGHFRPDNEGVTIGTDLQAPEKPVVLHELLHAYHYRVMPGRMQNPDILRFYGIAKRAGLYPPGSYVMKDQREFFAVTASLYLWGNVNRPPFNRDTLRKRQPVYYEWLGQLFGVKK